MKIAIFGAGSIGVYIGGSLLASGAEVVLVGRARMRQQIAREGLLLTDLSGRSMQLAAVDVPYAETAAALADADLILVTVKSADTPAAATEIAAHAKPSALIVSLQNGVGNADTLRQALPGWTILGGMVPFNVAQMAGSRFHRATGGELVIEASPALRGWETVFRAAHLPLQESDEFPSMQWGKLLLNLNNSVNALSDLPLKAELSQRAYRRCLALLIEEALPLLRAAGIRPAKIARVGPQLLPTLLRLPDALFKRLAATMLQIDPEARSSMWDDLHNGRLSEVDYLNGAIVRLAESLGREAAANRRITALIHAAEGTTLRPLSGEVLYSALAGASQKEMV
ncbi:2-dehydropantoate 2-reductase family protein [Collimonas arenae]|uniref:2-dehydropantoate 2-reductase n=1 Tax=Collimonas arenae TaxID=279058 RepID=A0A127PNI3_9BURK|nr:2-dehydropantoate 2-reductase [Collimonas arenae]AMO98971.1 2-dehydropantoate 2-reductase family protein [Collimonas arenae]AMP08864.1 2-dehydropantoate 2-reductase family protein [Collimonas arenae]